MVERSRILSPDRETRSRPLYHIDGGNSVNPRNLALIRAFSRMKYGDPEATAHFAEQLSKKLKEEVRLGDTFIVTPPYSRLFSSVVSLAIATTQKLGIGRGELRTRGEVGRNVVYASIRTQEERDAARNSVDVYLQDDGLFRNLRAILLDDIETTGATFEQMKTVVGSYSIPIAGTYSVAVLDTSDPAREEWVNTFLLDNDPRMLIQILNSPLTTINRHTLKSIMNLSEEARAALMRHFTQEALDKFNQARMLYYYNR
jgi:adenine/guanine phosphoribosyltransferase-like PRPP-binding protein